MHFDEDETWSDNGASSASTVDLQMVATHEIGHALGLGHTQESRCGYSVPPDPTRPLMCAAVHGVQRNLGPDDVNGIQSLYGPPDPIAEGYTVDSTYRPDNDITRAAVTRMLFRLDGGGAQVLAAPDFTDVPGWVAGAVAWAIDDPDGTGGIDPL